MLGIPKLKSSFEFQLTREDEKIQIYPEQVKLHSKRVEKMEKYTRNEWRRWKNTLETSGENGKLHSKRVFFFRLLLEKS